MKSLLLKGLASRLQPATSTAERWGFGGAGRTTQAPTTTVPPEVSDSPDQGGNDNSGQGSSEQTATTLH
jgi:hypothetical protein